VGRKKKKKRREKRGGRGKASFALAHRARGRVRRVGKKKEKGRGREEETGFSQIDSNATRASSLHPRLSEGGRGGGKKGEREVFSVGFAFLVRHAHDSTVQREGGKKEKKGGRRRVVRLVASSDCQLESRVACNKGGRRRERIKGGKGRICPQQFDLMPSMIEPISSWKLRSNRKRKKGKKRGGGGRKKAIQ